MLPIFLGVIGCCVAIFFLRAKGNPVAHPDQAKVGFAQSSFLPDSPHRKDQVK